LVGLVGDKATVDQARKLLGKIVSLEVRGIVLSEFKKRIDAGKTPCQALSEPIIHPVHKTLIKATKMRHGNADEAFPVTHRSRQGEHYKLLKHEGYACLEIRIEGGETKIELLRHADVLLEKGKKPPVAVWRYYKGDIVIDGRDQRKFVIGQFKDDSSKRMALVPIVSACNSDEITVKDGKRYAKDHDILNFSVVAR
jgi:hypothetical protein